MAEKEKRPPGEAGRALVGVDSVSETYRESPKKATRQQRWAARNPLARWAHVALQSALRRGLIERGPCEVCGEEPADAHHDDYEKPMAVRFLCRRHHAALHRRMKQG